jgi:hypothetical protein
VRFNPDDLTFSNDLSLTDDMVSAHCHNEGHVAMRRNCRISLEKNASKTYVIAEGSKLRNRVSEIELYGDGISQAESTVLSFLWTGSSAISGQLCHGGFFRFHAYDCTIREVAQVHYRVILKMKIVRLYRAIRPQPRGLEFSF